MTAYVKQFSKVSQPYTKEDDEVIKLCLQENLNNLSAGYKKAAEKLGRTMGAVAQRWSTVKKKEKILSLKAENGNEGIPNTKNVAQKVPVSSKDQESVFIIDIDNSEKSHMHVHIVFNKDLIGDRVTYSFNF